MSFGTGQDISWLPCVKTALGGHDLRQAIRYEKSYRSGTINGTDRKVDDKMAITASDARAHLFPLIQQVIDDHAPVRISSKAGDAVLMSAADYDSWQETIYLLRSPANARRLLAPKGAITSCAAVCGSSRGSSSSPYP